MSLNTGDQGYNNGKKYGQKSTLCGPNILKMDPDMDLKHQKSINNTMVFPNITEKSHHRNIIDQNFSYLLLLFILVLTSK
jgi:hypothetical protein